MREEKILWKRDDQLTQGWKEEWQVEANEFVND